MEIIQKYIKGNCTFAELDRYVEIANKLMDAKMKKFEEAIEEKKK